MSNAITYRMAGGIPGDITRIGGGVTVETQPINHSAPVLAYGLACAVDSSGVRQLAAGDASAIPNELGVAVRPFPTQPRTTAADFGAIPLGTQAAPPTAGPLDVLRRGYITMKFTGSGVPAKGGKVWIWAAATSGGNVQGQPEASDPSGSGFLLANAYFMGPVDANGNVEVAFNV